MSLIPWIIFFGVGTCCCALWFYVALYDAYSNGNKVGLKFPLLFTIALAAITAALISAQMGYD